MSYPPAQAYPATSQPRRRPIGVTILAILLILGGIFLVLLSLAVVALGVLFLPSLGFLGVAIGLVILILSFLVLAAGFALLSLKPWAWWLTAIVLVLYLASQVSLMIASAAINIVAVAIPGLILVYLIAVRKHFR